MYLHIVAISKKRLQFGNTSIYKCHVICYLEFNSSAFLYITQQTQTDPAYAISIFHSVHCFMSKFKPFLSSSKQVII